MANSSLPTITEYSDEEIAMNAPWKVWSTAANDLEIPDALAGKYACVLAVVTNVDLTDAQIAQLEDAVAAVPGVVLAKGLLGSARLSTDRLPADTATVDNQLRMQVTQKLVTRAVPIPE